jgi:protein-S-isoprenylcysteine O-methyltransferase Ste14
LRAGPGDAELRQLRRELALQRLRLRVVNGAIALAALSAFLTCCAILALFVGGLTRGTQSVLPLALFAAAVAAVIVSLALFIWEVRVSGRALAAETEDLQ